MNGIFNKNFLTGLVLAKDLQQTEKFVVALSAGDSKSLMGAVLGPKLLIDKRLELEVQKTTAETKLKETEQQLVILKRPFSIKVNAPTIPVSASLTIDGGTAEKWRLESPVTGIALTPDGALGIQPTASGNISILVDDGGVTRNIVLVVT
jgi:hypothetical protein